MQTNFSPNMIKTYNTCPKKYYYQYIEHVTMPKSALPFEKGKKIHALANYYLQGIKIDRLETALDDYELKLWNLLKNNEYYNKDYLKSEFSLYCRLGDYWLGGRLDAVVYEGDNYFILDYKTGSIPKNAESDPQTMVYCLCLDRYLKNYNSISFVYINLKNDTNYKIQFNDELKKEYTKNLIKTCDIIKANSQYKPNPQACLLCEYAKLCHAK